MTTASELEAVSDRTEHMAYMCFATNPLRILDENIVALPLYYYYFFFFFFQFLKLLSVCLFGLFCVKATNCHFVVPRLAEVGLVDDLESFWV